MKYLIAAIILLSAASPSSARGIKCGNSYISANKVCHKDTPSYTPAPVKTVPAAKTDTMFKTAKTNTNVNLRVAASGDADKITVINKGETVTVYECGVKWCNIMYLDKVGYIVKSALTF